MEDNNIGIEEKLIIDIASLLSGENVVELLTKKHMPTAMVVIEDIYVIKIIKQLEAADIKVTKDISIASFSNIPVAEYFSPSLTSVKLNGFKLEQGLVKYF